MRGNLSAIRGFTLLLALLLTLPCARSSWGGTKFPPLSREADLGGDRQPLFRMFSPWNIDPLLFPLSGAGAALERAENEAPRDATASFRRAEVRAVEARKGGDNPRVWEEAARSYMLAYAAAKSRPLGDIALRRAARAYYFAGNYREADGILARVIARLGKGSPEGLAFYLLKGESLARQGNYLASRECFRRAGGGKWDAETARRIVLRIADLSLLSGNTAFAVPSYRKVLSSSAAYLSYPYEAVRYGDALVDGGKPAEAADVYRALQGDGFPPEVRAAAFLGEGDVHLLRGEREAARFDYQQAETGQEVPPLRGWIHLRKADLELAAGNYGAAAEKYAALRPVDGAAAREAGHKRILSLYLAGNFDLVVRESSAFLAKNPSGTPGSGAVRRMAARAGAEIVRRAGAGEPSSRWPAFASFLFSFGGTAEGKELYLEIGKEWESAGIWGGASQLYASGGNDGRSAEMVRLERAERYYVGGDLDGALQALDVMNPSRAPSNGALWLAAKIFLRQGKYEEAAKTVRRIPAPRPAEATPAKLPAPPEIELLACSLGLQEKWGESYGVLRVFDRPAQAPTVRFLADLAESRAGGSKPSIAASRPGARGAAGGDLLAVAGNVQARFLRVMERDGSLP